MSKSKMGLFGFLPMLFGLSGAAKRESSYNVPVLELMGARRGRHTYGIDHSYRRKRKRLNRIAARSRRYSRKRRNI